MVDLAQKNENGETLKVAEAKRGIYAIEGLFHAVNSANYSPRFMDGLRIGLEYIGQLHTRLIAQIGPEEVEKMRKANSPAQKPPEIVRPN